MKRIMLLTAAIAFAMALTGCGAKKASPTVSMFDLSQRMLEAHGGADEMAYASSSDSNASELLSHVSSIDPGKVEAFFISYAKDGKGNADEIVVIAVKDANDAGEAASTLQEHVESRIALYGTYDPEQVPMLEAADVFTSGQYAVLIVSKNADAVRRAFDEFIGAAR